MKPAVVVPFLIGLVAARPLTFKREVPLEHAHEDTLRAVRELLNLNNPNKLGDPVFCLLGNAAAQQGLGQVNKDPDCLQQEVADQAFTNAKQAGNVEGMTQALIFRALERNSAAVGQPSGLCKTLKAVNPEIAALQQHQDPAGQGAAALNKQIALELAKQIASIGGDPLNAIKSGTFLPGQIGDPTAAGNTCNDQNDPKGCINTLNKLNPDVTPEEIAAAIQGVNVNANVNANANANEGKDKGKMGGMGGGKVEDNKNNENQKANNEKEKQKQENNEKEKQKQKEKENNEKQKQKEKENNEKQKQKEKENNEKQKQKEKENNEKQKQKEKENNEKQKQENEKQKQKANNEKQENEIIQTCAAILGVNINVNQVPVYKANIQQIYKPNIQQMYKPNIQQVYKHKQAANNGGAALNLGSCGDATIVFGDGFDGRKEASFKPKSEADFPHGSALGIKVITDFICQQLKDKCKAPQATIDACNAGAAAAQGAQGQAAADAFNTAIGGGAANAGAGAAAPGQADAGNANAGAGAVDAGNANAGAGAVDAGNANAGAGAAAGGNLNFGKCGSPAIEFGVGFDGRKEPSFQPINKADFNHGSAQNIKVITGFIIDRLKDQCQASEATIAAAQSAAQAADATGGREQAAADAWNTALGVSA